MTRIKQILPLALIAKTIAQTYSDCYDCSGLTVECDPDECFHGSGLGCNACGQGQQCRFCGDGFLPCKGTGHGCSSDPNPTHSPTTFVPDTTPEHGDGHDGGCRAAEPFAIKHNCDCNPNPSVAVYAGCDKNGNPAYFDSNEDIPNGACIAHYTPTDLLTTSGTSLTTCSTNIDCIADTYCQDGFCADVSGFREQDRLVQTCVSPKHTTSGHDNQMAGCGTSDGNMILDCHRWWISEQGMEWRHYLQFNPYGQGDAYAWAYDEAVCATSDHSRWSGNGYPWCVEQGPSGSAIDENGNVIDHGCPCTVQNPIAPLGATSFAENGWGTNMHLHVYDIMWPGYKPPTQRNQFYPAHLAPVSSEQDMFFLKVINQYDSDILVYMDVPPSRYMERVSSHVWQGWNGPTKSLRGRTRQYNGANDAWVSRITIAPNTDPSHASQPEIRCNGDGIPIGGFYVPKGYHLRIHIADKYGGGGWFGSASGSTVADKTGGTSVWVTRADAYNYPDRDPLLLLEQNVNTAANPSQSFDDTTVWFDVSAVDGINSNVQLLYGKIDRTISTPLFQSEL